MTKDKQANPRGSNKFVHKRYLPERRLLFVERNFGGGRWRIRCGRRRRSPCCRCNRRGRNFGALQRCVDVAGSTLPRGNECERNREQDEQCRKDRRRARQEIGRTARRHQARRAPSHAKPAAFGSLHQYDTDQRSCDNGLNDDEKMENAHEKFRNSGRHSADDAAHIASGPAIFNPIRRISRQRPGLVRIWRRSGLRRR
jgi:hypothetical protein